VGDQDVGGGEYARLRALVERSLARPTVRAKDEGVEVERERRALQQSLLDEERRAWVNAHGSSYLRMAFADGAGDNQVREKRLIAEFLRATESDRRPQHPGWFFELRLPGDELTSAFVVTAKGAKELGAFRVPDDVWLHSSAKNDEQVLLNWRARSGQTQKREFATEEALGKLGVLSGEAKRAVRWRGLEEQKARAKAMSPSERIRALFTRPAAADVQVRALLSVANDGTAEFLVAAAGRYQIETARRQAPGPLGPRDRAAIDALKAFAVHAEQARALRAQCELSARLEARYGRRLSRVPERGARGTFDRLITTTDGRKCAVVVAKDALYLVQQGAQDWRAMLGREVALGKTNNDVSLRAAPQRTSARLFGLER
jgi:hypothetical protein